MYLTGVYSTDWATTSAFLIHIYTLDTTPEDIVNIISRQLKEMQGGVIPNPADNLKCNMPAHPLKDTLHTTYFDDDRIRHTTTMLSPPSGKPHPRTSKNQPKKRKQQNTKGTYITHKTNLNARNKNDRNNPQSH